MRNFIKGIIFAWLVRRTVMKAIDNEFVVKTVDSFFDKLQKALAVETPTEPRPGRTDFRAPQGDKGGTR